MLRRRRATTVVRQPLARGGVSLGAACTGFAVALGGMLILGAAAAAILTALHTRTDTLSHGATLRAAVVGIVGIAAGQLVAYLWGGYAAGRMARGAGIGNGILVAVVALVVGAIAAATGWGLDLASRIDVPFAALRFNLSHARLVQFATALAVSSAGAMILGGAIGGGLGARWHTKLERRAAANTPVTVDRDDTLDLRSRTAAPVNETVDVPTP